MTESEKDRTEKIMPEDTALDEYPVPDASVSFAMPENVNFSGRDMLPLSADRACKLAESMTVYAVFPDETLKMPWWEIRQYPPDTVFAVRKRDWERSMDFHMALNDRMSCQIQRERAFLRHTGDCFAIYQQRSISVAEMPGYVPLETARTAGLSPRAAGYEMVYTSPLTEKSDVAELEKQFRERPPADFHCRSVRPGDVIAVKKDGELKAWYLDKLAFTGMPGLFENIPLYRTGEHGEHLPLTDEIPVYRETGQYAQAHGELKLYLDSQKTNIACRDAIDHAVAANYRSWCLDANSAVRQVRDEFGYDRMLYVLAYSICHNSWDGRISRDNIRWAEACQVTPDTSGGGRDLNICFLSETHPGLLDMFAKAARRDYEKSRPLSAEEITGEAERIFTEFKTMEGPNGPNYQSFVVQFSPDFVTRANEGDYVMLSSMMPFKSFETTPLRDFYSSGMFAQISGDEKRGPGRLKPPLYKPKRLSAKRKKGPER